MNELERIDSNREPAERALNGAEADVLVTPNRDGEWVVSRDFSAEPVESLDPTRPLAKITVNSSEPVGHPSARGFAKASGESTQADSGMLPAEVSVSRPPIVTPHRPRLVE